MRNGDFSADAFGNPISGMAIINPNMIGTSTNPAVYPNIYFQCDPSGNPLPAAASGLQPKGTPCNKTPNNMFSSIGQAMINLYPAPNVTGNPSYNFADVPVRRLDE